MEASSLAGFSFIASSKSLGFRSAWIVAVILSVFFAIYQIHSTFKSWDQNPVSTDIEVLPISGVKLPGITVCPPKGSHTALNYDLIRTKNITLDNMDRQEMINIAVNHIIFKESELYKDFHETFVEEDRPRNWLEGISYISLPSPPNYDYVTTALSGSVSTPSFGEHFDQEKFLPQVHWNYSFIIPPTLKIDYPGTIFVIDLTFDTISYGSQESIEIGFIWDHDPYDPEVSLPFSKLIL